MKKTQLVVLLVLAAAMLLLAAAPTRTILARLEIRNKTDKYVKLSLNGDGNFYFLTVNPYTIKIFTVERAIYNQTTYACGTSASGILDLSTNVRLVFPPCNRKEPNQGTPTIEKIYLQDIPSHRKWRWRYY